MTSEIKKRERQHPQSHPFCSMLMYVLVCLESKSHFRTRKCIRKEVHPMLTAMVTWTTAPGQRNENERERLGIKKDIGMSSSISSAQKFICKHDIIAPILLLWALIVPPSFALAKSSPSSSSLSSDTTTTPSLLKLQTIHPELSPTETFRKLSKDCEALGIENFDVYGDFESDPSTSYLRQFEQELATEFGMDDAVFMPSGVMAQSIALQIHSTKKSNKNDDNKPTTRQRRSKFACHRTSHLLLHENDSYRELSGMESVVLPKDRPTTFPVDPLLWKHVQEGLVSENDKDVSCLILEMPHRELGGKTTPLEDILKMQAYCNANDIAFHCDGARIFEASTAYPGKTLADLAAPFDSFYISFYKGLGGLSGAMLMGSTEFCEEARVWLGRFGGNLFTLLPYAVAGWAGYRRQWKEALTETSGVLSFQDKKEKLIRITQAVSSDICAKVLSFDPAIPAVNIVHVYFRASYEACNQARDSVQKETDICLFHRLRELQEDDPAFQEGYRAKTELSMGEFNGNIDDEIFITAFEQFCRCVIEGSS